MSDFFSQPSLTRRRASVAAVCFRALVFNLIEAVVLAYSQHPRVNVKANLLRRFAVARKANQTNLEGLKKAIERHPGNRPGFFARLLGWRREEVNRVLTLLNDEGVLLWEDEQGGLWPCKDDPPN